MASGQAAADGLRRPAEGAHPEGDPAVRLRPEVRGAHFGGVGEPVGDPLPGEPPGLPGGPGVVGVHHRGRAFRERFVDLALRGGDLLEGGEVLEVRLGDGGDHGGVGDGDLGERPDLAGRGHAEFDHADFLVPGGGEQRERQAPLVVQVARRAEDPAGRADGGGGGFLRGGLAHAAGDRGDLGAAREAPASGEGAERGRGVVHFDEERAGGGRFGGPRGAPGDDRPGGAPGQRVGDEGVAVPVRPPDGEEEVPGGDSAAVDRNAGDLPRFGRRRGPDPSGHGRRGFAGAQAHGFLLTRPATPARRRGCGALPPPPSGRRRRAASRRSAGGSRGPGRR